MTHDRGSITCGAHLNPIIPGVGCIYAGGSVRFACWRMVTPDYDSGGAQPVLVQNSRAETARPRQHRQGASVIYEGRPIHF